MNFKKFLISSVLILAVLLVAYFVYQNFETNRIATEVAQDKAAYEARLDFGAPDCEGVPLSDAILAQKMAGEGDAFAQYVHGWNTVKSAMKNNRVADDAKADEGRAWIRKAAENGDVYAQGSICNSYWNSDIYSYLYRRKPDMEDPRKYTYKLEACFSAANHGHKGAQSVLGILYSKGFAVPRNYEEAYFWARLDGNRSKGNIDRYASFLNEDQIARQEQRISEWKPQEPALTKNKYGLSTRKSAAFKLPTNYSGLICGGTAKDCEIRDVCNNLVAISCARARPKYVIADMNTKEIVSSCPDKNWSCLDLVPEEWSCPTPNNMPLTKAEQEKFPKYKNSISCGNVLGLGYSRISHSYTYIHKVTGERTIVGGPVTYNRNSEPPKEWYCGRPSN